MNTADISCRIESGAFAIIVIDVQKTIEFDKERYAHLCWNLMEELDCLGDLDYSNNRDCPAAVEITCPGQQTIYIAPEGFDYPRYVGIEHIERKESNE